MTMVGILPADPVWMDTIFPYPQYAPDLAPRWGSTVGSWGRPAPQASVEALPVSTYVPSQVVVVYRPSGPCDYSENVYSLLAKVKSLEQSLTPARDRLEATQRETVDVSERLASQIVKYIRRKAEAVALMVRDMAFVAQLQAENSELREQISLFRGRGKEAGASFWVVVVDAEVLRTFFLAFEAEVSAWEAYRAIWDQPSPSSVIRVTESAMVSASSSVRRARDQVLEQYEGVLVPVDTKYRLGEGTYF